jgi:phosphatidylglycerol---prolipoprotein diacylglyceryl transferase
MEHFIWNADPVLLNLGFLRIRWYGLMFALAFVFAYSTMQWIYKREHKNPDDLDRLLWHMAIGTVLGARLGHTLLYDPQFYLAHPLRILAVWEGGLASHGAIVGIMLSLVIYVRSTKDSYIWLLDRMAVPGAMSGSFIRLGNFFNSEILGYETNQPWGVIFARVDPLPRHPVQLYEALSYILIFWVMLFIYRKTYQKPIKGLLFGTMMFLVFTARILLENFKTEQAMYDTGLPLTTGQLLSIPFIVIGVGFMIWSIINYRAKAAA